jgi:ABC-type phosphate transport system substrate-binding protein
MRAALMKSLQRAAVYFWLAAAALGCGRSSPPKHAQQAAGELEEADSTTAIPQYTTRQFSPD